jgi:L-asparaginase
MNASPVLVETAARVPMSKPDAASDRSNALFRVALISTGGTIEKTYDELGGVLANKVSVLDMLLASLDLRGVVIDRVALMNKDSLEMSEADHDLIADTAEQLARDHDGVVIVHGTDRLAKTGDRIHGLLAAKGGATKAIVLTGAMRPYEMRRTDATQNVTEALTAVQILAPGVYVAMHNRVLRFPGVTKDPKQGTFVRQGAFVRA